MTIDPQLLARFDRDLTRLLPQEGRLGVAVSGGPDSLALLLLAAAARPGEVQAATVDHELRAESRAECAFVAAACERVGVPHATLNVHVRSGASLQAQAREARYEALAGWASKQGLAAVLTAHHADDQAETLLMRLARGSGLGGLAGIRASRPLADRLLVRPLLGWRRAELLSLIHGSWLTPLQDSSNSDPRHDRTRARAFLAQQPWLDPERLAASAAHLTAAEEALTHAAAHLFKERASELQGALALKATDLPGELQRRLLLLAFSELGAAAPRGPDLGRALATLRKGGSCTLGGLKLEGGERWRLRPEPPRR